MPPRPLVVIRIGQLVGWLCVVIGLYAGYRGASGMVRVTGLPGGSAGLDGMLMGLVPGLLLVGFGMVVVLLAYLVDARHAGRDGARTFD